MRALLTTLCYKHEEATGVRVRIANEDTKRHTAKNQAQIHKDLLQSFTPLTSLITSHPSTVTSENAFNSPSIFKR